MTAETVAELFAAVVLAGLIGTGAGLAWPTSRSAITAAAPIIAALVAAGATAGSLYFSEVAHFVPCKLCWFQRIAMYPLAIVLPLAAARRDRGIMVYAGALSLAVLVTDARAVSDPAGPR